MKLRVGQEKRRVATKGTELLRVEKPQDYSVKKFFTSEEWEAVEERVFRDIRGLGELQDRYFLFMVTENPQHSLKPHEEELFQKTKDFLTDVVTKSNKEKTLLHHNFSQALHVAAFLSRAFPDRKHELPLLHKIREFAQETPEELFAVGFGPVKTPIDIRIVLVKLTNYLSTFPEDAPWLMKEANRRLPSSVVQKALDELEKNNDWEEYLQLGAVAKMMYPGEVRVSHTPEIWDHLRTITDKESFTLYTRLPDLLNFRILTSEKTTISPSGTLEIEDGENPLDTNSPLPERLVA